MHCRIKTFLVFGILFVEYLNVLHKPPFKKDNVINVFYTVLFFVSARKIPQMQNEQRVLSLVLIVFLVIHLIHQLFFVQEMKFAGYIKSVEQFEQILSLIIS